MACAAERAASRDAARDSIVSRGSHRWWPTELRCRSRACSRFPPNGQLVTSGLERREAVQRSGVESGSPRLGCFSALGLRQLSSIVCRDAGSGRFVRRRIHRAAEHRIPRPFELGPETGRQWAAWEQSRVGRGGGCLDGLDGLDEVEIETPRGCGVASIENRVDRISKRRRGKLATR